MRKRTRAREYALRLLYQFDITKEKIDNIRECIAEEHAHSDEVVFVGDSVSDLEKSLALQIDFIAKLGTTDKFAFEKKFNNVVTINSIEELREIF